MEKVSLLSKVLKSSFILPIAVTSFIAISSVAYSSEGHEGCMHSHWDKAKQGEYFQKRQMELHDKLALSSSQEPAWKSFVEKTKPSDRHPKEDWAEISKLSTPERLDHMLARTKEHEAEVEQRVQATKVFYSQLTPAQQKTFDASFQPHEQHEHEEENEPHE
jgi:periplasmic protein CpxP/Spy